MTAINEDGRESMDAQAMLVRYVKQELLRFFAGITIREQSSGDRQRRFRSMILTFLVSTWGTASLGQQWTQPQPYASEGYYAPQDAATYAALLPDRRDQSDRLFGRIREATLPYAQESWIRLEYLNAKIDHRGGGALGTSIRDLSGNLINTSKTFEVPIFDPINIPPLPLTVNAIAPSTEETDWDDVAGIRGSFGIPLDKQSWIEGSVMGLEEQNTRLIAPTIPPTSLNPLFGVDPVLLIVIPYTINGQAGTLSDPTDPTTLIPAPLIAYDASFFSDYKVNVWSAEVNHVYNLRNANDGWTVQSIFGYRHEEYSERLTFGGSFDSLSSGYATDGTINPGPLATPQANMIDSKVHNYRNALQLGFRTEVKQYGLTLGVEPKVALGLGLIRSRVTTSNAREPGNLSVFLNNPNLVIDDPDSTTEFDRELDFAPSAELNLYAKYDVTSWLKLRVGYNLTWMGRVGVADASIQYNTFSAVDPTLTPDTLDIGLNQRVNDRYISGITIGGEIVFP